MKLPPLKINFTRSPSKNYKRALTIIQSHRSYNLDEGDDRTVVIPPVHEADYNLLDSKDRAQALELGLLCGKWANFNMWMGKFTFRRYMLNRISFCASVYDGERHCFGRISPMSSDYFIWGCRILGDFCNSCEAVWYEYGHLDEKGGVFYLHKGDILSNLKEECIKLGIFFCPYFDFTTISKVLGNLPNEIDPREDSKWNYRWAVRYAQEVKVGVEPAGKDAPGWVWEDLGQEPPEKD